MLEIGSVIDGKYKILNEVGHGGMSTVYLAINEKANKPWAIKEVRKAGVKDFEIVRQSLMVETDLLKKLKHPSLPSIIDIIDHDENFLIVMDYIEGNTLEKVLREYGIQSQENVVSWAIQLCDVFQYLHTRKPPIIYRDMKPSNVMLKSDGSVVLIDFGTAREFKERNVADTTCLGTQGYAAPEQFGGQGQTDARTDIYCLGATMYHLVTGHNPSEPPYEMYPITQWNPNLSSGLEKIISKCTQRNPHDRYQTADELMYALEHYKDLDESAMKKYKGKLALFAATIGMSLICGITSIAMHVTAQGKQRDVYQTYIDMADKTTAQDEAVDYYFEAIDTDSTRADAYEGLYNIFIEDGSFSDEEEEILLKLNVSVGKYFQNFAQKNPSAYADFCYDIGNAYWFYYNHEESRQSNAVAWFKSARDIYKKDPDKAMEYKRSMLYVEIGNFYKKVVAAQIDGTDAGMYGEYWNNLVTIKQLNDENPDRELITLRLYKEIITRSTEYAKYLSEDGITKEDVLNMYTQILEDMDRMEENSTSTVKDEISNIRTLIGNADNMLDSSFQEGAGKQ